MLFDRLLARRKRNRRIGKDIPIPRDGSLHLDRIEIDSKLHVPPLEPANPGLANPRIKDRSLGSLLLDKFDEFILPNRKEEK